MKKAGFNQSVQMGWLKAIIIFSLLIC